MTKLIMYRGLPASGKSTLAKAKVKEGNWYRVNRDLLRTMLHFDKWTGKNEQVTIKMEKAIVRGLLKDGKNVLVDDCNLSDHHKEMWSEIARQCDAKFEIKDVDTDVDTCLLRDSKREKKVGVVAISSTALQYKRTKIKTGIVVCDIDGTVADIKHRLHYVRNDDGTPKEKKDWNGFFSEMEKDEPRDYVFKMLESFYQRGYDIVFVTARPQDHESVTLKWLVDNCLDRDLDFVGLIMRRSGDSRPDTEVKQEIYDRYLKHYPVHCVLDDRPSVIRMWRANNLKVLDVGQGKEF